MVDHLPNCSGFIVIHKDNVLLVRSKKGGHWGKRNKNETLENCTIRELKEETGLFIYWRNKSI
jgi:ADP-ribose pyrophosphatase YjhB (NUDIX family)